MYLTTLRQGARTQNQLPFCSSSFRGPLRIIGLTWPHQLEEPYRTAHDMCASERLVFAPEKPYVQDSISELAANMC